MDRLGAPRLPEQLPLFHVEKQVEIDGVEMGVLENGIPYLSESGLARMCGIHRAVLNRLAVGWADERLKPRGSQIAEFLEKNEYSEPTLFLKSEHKGIPINAYTEPVCIALLRYYAFKAEEKRPEALRAFDSLVKNGFRKFIYEAVGYSPEHKIVDHWQHLYDRADMTQNAAPIGYWGVFNEAFIMIIPMIRAGIIISDKLIPDISMGRTWSDFWKKNNLEDQFGSRTKYDHEYPDYYPQAKSNPQASHAYPNAALGAFRDWLRKNYIENIFPKYLLRQVSKGSIPLQVANKAIEAFSEKQLENNTETKKLK